VYPNSELDVALSFLLYWDRVVDSIGTQYSNPMFRKTNSESNLIDGQRRPWNKDRGNVIQVQPVYEEVRLWMVIGMEIEIAHANDLGHFSNDMFDKRSRTIIQDMISIPITFPVLSPWQWVVASMTESSEVRCPAGPCRAHQFQRKEMPQHIGECLFRNLGQY